MAKIRKRDLQARIKDLQQEVWRERDANAVLKTFNREFAEQARAFRVAMVAMAEKLKRLEDEMQGLREYKIKMQRRAGILKVNGEPV